MLPTIESVTHVSCTIQNTISSFSRYAIGGTNLPTSFLSFSLPLPGSVRILPEKQPSVGVNLQWTWPKGPSPPPHALIGGRFLN
jgi:hypothetical protein